ncbi:MAG: DUF3508 domain-containing protein, partial [Planctomycetales bacterium]|nr:DUF3508 domain-containing protein [Planctomycetales bacterium]
APYGAGQPAANPYVDPRMAQAPQRNDNAAPQQPAGPPPQGLDGFCPVTLLEKGAWQRGDERFGIIHRGRLYLFASEADKEKFWTNPDHYSPVLSGNDPVEFVESGRLVPGDRRHGVFYRDRVYLFTNEASLQRFWSSPQRYADHALQAMRTTAGDRR